MAARHTVLIVGSIGFIGHHIVSHFLSDHNFSKIVVLSRSAASSRFRVTGAIYVTGDIADHISLNAIPEDIRPTVVIHAASPSPVTGTAKEYSEVNILGTQNLLKHCKESSHIRAFIYTSSSTLARGPAHNNLDETCPLADTDPKAPPYAVSKARAELMVLRANHFQPVGDRDERSNWAGYLATGSLRFPIVYGIGDHTAIPGCLDALAKGQTTATLGDGTNLWSFCSVKNAARAHMLLAFALLKCSSRISPDMRVDGEAFNINDGAPFPFWGFAKLCWKFAGYDPRPEPKMTHIPAWFALALATFLEMVY